MGETDLTKSHERVIRILGIINRQILLPDVHITGPVGDFHRIHNDTRSRLVSYSRD